MHATTTAAGPAWRCWQRSGGALERDPASRPPEGRDMQGHAAASAADWGAAERAGRGRRAVRVRVVAPDGVAQAAGRVRDRHRAVAHREQLVQPARLEAAGHEQHVARGHDAVRERDREADPAAEGRPVRGLRAPHGRLVLGAAAAQHHQLRARAPLARAALPDPTIPPTLPRITICARARRSRARRQPRGQFHQHAAGSAATGSALARQGAASSGASAGPWSASAPCRGVETALGSTYASPGRAPREQCSQPAGAAQPAERL